jgi:hypothetical protein
LNINDQLYPVWLEVVSKPQIRFKGKASGRTGKRSIRGYVSIYRRPATQPLGLRWGFETTSRAVPGKVLYWSTDIPNGYMKCKEKNWDFYIFLIYYLNFARVLKSETFSDLLFK